MRKASILMTKFVVRRIMLRFHLYALRMIFIRSLMNM